MKQETRILVVDDEINIRNALVTILEKAGYLAQGADSAESALALMALRTTLKSTLRSTRI